MRKKLITNSDDDTTFNDEDLTTPLNFDDGVVSDDTDEISISPLESISQEDSIDEAISGKNNILKKITPAKWEALINILDFLTKESDDSIIISKSVIMYGYKGGSVIKVNLKEVFDGQEIDLHISSPKKWTRLFKTLKDTNIYILDDENKFIVTDGQIKLFLPKQIESYISTLTFPDFNKTETVCQSIIQKDSRDKILRLGKDLEYIEFLIKDKQLKSINIPNTAVFILPEFLKDKDIRELTNSSADLSLRTQTFLPYSADTYRLIIGKNQINDSYFSYTICNSLMMQIEIYEQLNNSSGISDLF